VGSHHRKAIGQALAAGSYALPSDVRAKIEAHERAAELRAEAERMLQGRRVVTGQEMAQRTALRRQAQELERQAGTFTIQTVAIDGPTESRRSGRPSVSQSGSTWTHWTGPLSELVPAATNREDEHGRPRIGIPQARQAYWAEHGQPPTYRCRAGR
jgi:hypothetical protein